ncbi:MAG TPA: Wadjet anti-phage system protein JetD domain-containing protein [Pyrinomonadaceae bacterium]
MPFFLRWTLPGQLKRTRALLYSRLRWPKRQSGSCRRVITVENATSFSQLVALRAPRVLALYTGGFASPAVTSLLRRARAASPQTSLLHWGDLDAGGLRILAHLRASLATNIRPLAMDVLTFEEHRDYTQSLTGEDRRALTRLRDSPALTDCAELIDLLLAEGRKLEQEAVSAQRALASLDLE